MAEQVNAQNELNIKDIWERLIILGYYADEAALKSAHATGTVGDCYKVGDDLYVWSGTEWVDIGRIKGDKGDTSYDAATAGKLKSPVNLSVTDGNGGHKGAATPFDGSANVELVLPAIIKAALEGNATTATMATKLGTSTVGGVNQPVYLAEGAPKVCTGDRIVEEKLDINGYVKYASGFTIQWGFTSSTTITYPIPFATWQRCILVTPGKNTLTSIPSWQTTEHSTTGFTVQWSDDTTPKFCWLALGH